ncbi:4-(cytidine 5'-diphospho)-2-C-methyl-D-erythritol kinase [bacterium]|nr:4-(cytidine 5'-diphospho)-2-C-methyl-D-erythritol kinase [FCB group bacterium]MBL7190601.1 4-(cytidine 5'-diphospho)-2-C-methyl-D-erythritol kinase [bacterium]
MKKLTIQAPAKINIGLEAGGLRPDGYHEICTFMQTAACFDEIHISIADKFSFSHDRADLPSDENNICVKAYRKLTGLIGQELPVSMELIKRIPIGAGMGGGSSDAAAALKGINELYHLNFNDEELASIGVELGADVPFFIISKGSALCEGIGEKVTAMESLFAGWVVIVFTGLLISTEWAYRKLDENLTFRLKNINLKDYLLKCFPALKGLNELKNDFDEVVFQYYRDLEKIKVQLVRLGASYSSLTGSGSAVYGLFASEEKALEALVHLKEYPFKIAVRTPAPPVPFVASD